MNKRMVIIQLLLILFFITNVSADTVELKSGAHIIGDIVKETENTVTVSEEDGKIVYSLSREDIKEIRESTPGELQEKKKGGIGKAITKKSRNAFQKFMDLIEKIRQDLLGEGGDQTEKAGEGVFVERKARQKAKNKPKKQPKKKQKEKISKTVIDEKVEVKEGKKHVFGIKKSCGSCR